METWNHFEQIIKRLHQEAHDIVGDTAKDLTGDMQSRTPVDTGFLKTSEYYVTSDESTYGQASGRNAEVFPEITGVENDTTAYVVVSATYGIFVNNGTARQAAQPFFEPAIEAMRPKFEQKFTDLEERLHV